MYLLLLLAIFLPSVISGFGSLFILINILLHKLHSLPPGALVSIFLTLHTRQELGDTVSQFTVETLLKIGDDSLVEMRESLFETGEDLVEESRVTFSFSSLVILA